MKELFSFSNKIYSVSEFTRQINAFLEETFSYAHIEGEVSNCKPHSSGHIYFSIKDKESILACIMFKYNVYKLKFNLEDGMQVVCSGKIGVYEKRGQYQLYVDRIEPKGAGALQVAFEQLKAKLSREGLFDETTKKQIPFFPKRIGIVTSPTGAAIKDMLCTIFKRVPNMHVILYPVRVQGEKAAEEISCGIEVFNKLKNVDVIIIGRGGGSLEDLWSFNEEVVARAIYASVIPIISAVGHEADYSIADFVADKRALTPTAAGEMAVPYLKEFQDDIYQFCSRMRTLLQQKMEFIEAKLRMLVNSYAFRYPQAMVEQYYQRLDDIIFSARRNLNHLVELKEGKLAFLRQHLEVLNPKAILSRGYSITMEYPKGGVIKDILHVKSGQKIKTILSKGIIISEVK